MGVRIPIVFAALLAATSASAQDLTLMCSGEALDWSITLDGQNAEMNIGFLSDLEVMATTIAEGADWPRALTLLGNQDTAILILDQIPEASDEDATHTAQVLTQRGQTPILLTGTCVPLR